MHNDELLYVNRNIKIPDTANRLEVKLFPVTQAGQPCHRVAAATKAILHVWYVQRCVAPDRKQFVQNGLLCVLSRSGFQVEWSLTQALHDEAQWQVIHFDYPFHWEDSNSFKYCLMVKEEVSGYPCLKATPHATTFQTAEIFACKTGNGHSLS